MTDRQNEPGLNSDEEATQQPADESAPSLAAQLRRLPPGETLPLLRYLDSAMTIGEAIESVQTEKIRAKSRVAKTVQRANRDSDTLYRVTAQVVWNDTRGLGILTIITRDK